MSTLRDLFRKSTRAISRATWPQIRLLTSRGLVPMDVWRRIPIETSFAVEVPGPGPGSRSDYFRYRSTYGDMIGRSLCWRGIHAWEHETIAAFVPLARRARVFLDVGANTGAYALIAAAINPSVHTVAFDPLPAALDRLRENIALNGWQHRIEVIDAAVSDAPGEVQFHKPYGELPTSASLSVDGFRGIRGELITVRQVVIDDVVGDQPVDLVKLDVEGFEHKALAGMQKILTRSHPDIFAECFEDGPYREVDAILAPLGYRFVHLGYDGIHHELDHIDPVMPSMSRNILCTVHADWAERLRAG